MHYEIYTKNCYYKANIFSVYYKMLVKGENQQLCIIFSCLSVCFWL